MNFAPLLALLFLLTFLTACSSTPVPIHATSSSSSGALATQYQRLEKAGFCLPQSLPWGMGYAGGEQEEGSPAFEGDGETVWYQSKTKNRNFTVGFSAEDLAEPPAATRVAQGRAAAMNQRYVIYRDEDGLEASGLTCRPSGSGNRDLHVYVFFAPGITLSEANQVMRSFAARPQ